MSTLLRLRPSKHGASRWLRGMSRNRPLFPRPLLGQIRPLLWSIFGIQRLAKRKANSPMPSLIKQNRRVLNMSFSHRLQTSIKSRTERSMFLTFHSRQNRGNIFKRWALTLSRLSNLQHTIPTGLPFSRQPKKTMGHWSGHGQERRATLLVSLMSIRVWGRQSWQPPRIRPNTTSAVFSWKEERFPSKMSSPRFQRSLESQAVYTLKTLKSLPLSLTVHVNWQTWSNGLKITDTTVLKLILANMEVARRSVV
mmetsp:Transcript_22783/g.42352  ORF Transcript_22783/g.42352 Transcript_22783/m.42352 type:complete len:252 (-) Transcript_22783:92-847(-)